MAVDPPVSGQAENMSEFVHDHGFEPFYVKPVVFVQKAPHRDNAESVFFADA